MVSTLSSSLAIIYFVFGLIVFVCTVEALPISSAGDGATVLRTRSPKPVSIHTDPPLLVSTGIADGLNDRESSQTPMPVYQISFPTLASTSMSTLSRMLWRTISQTSSVSQRTGMALAMAREPARAPLHRLRATAPPQQPLPQPTRRILSRIWWTLWHRRWQAFCMTVTSMVSHEQRYTKCYENKNETMIFNMCISTEASGIESQWLWLYVIHD